MRVGKRRAVRLRFEKYLHSHRSHVEPHRRTTSGTLLVADMPPVSASNEMLTALGMSVADTSSWSMVNASPSPKVPIVESPFETTRIEPIPNAA